MRPFTILFILFCGIFSYAQIYEKYPPGQDDYLGGNKAYYKDFHQIVLEKKLKPCDNKDEYYFFRVVVYPNNTIKYLKDDDSISVSNNKCAFDLAREVAKFQKGWTPAIVDGQKVPAVAGFMIYPDDLFENYIEDYDPVNLVSVPEFDGGINEFRRLVANSIDLSKFRANQNFRLLVKFIVNSEGKIEDINLVESTANEDFNRTIISAIKSIKKQWKPAKIRERPVKYRFAFPLVFNFE